VATVRPLERKRGSKLTGAFDYAPLPVMDISFGAVSDRDLLREKEVGGVNIGEENRRSYDLRITFSSPKGAKMPTSPLLAPVRLVVKGLDRLNPSLQYSGGFADAHDPAQRQAGDPENIRSVSNSATWDLRLSFPIGDAAKSMFPERQLSAGQRDQMLASQRRLEGRDARRSPGGPAEQALGAGDTGLPPGGAVAPDGTTPPADETAPAGGTPPPGESPTTGQPTPAEDNELLTPEERQRREDERLLEAAEERLALEQEEQRARGEAPPAGEATVTDDGHGFGPRTLIEPFFSVLRNTTPLKLTMTTRNQSSYARLLDTAPFWYAAGFTTDIGVDPSRYAASALDRQESISLATSSKLTRQISVDLKYSKADTWREQVGSESRSRREDWPDIQVSLTGIEKWRVLGGGKKEGEGWFRSSSINVGYKKNLVVNNFTGTVYNPTISTALQPRWSFTFASGLSATLNANLKWDDVKGNGVTTKTTQSRYGLQVRHQFRAEQFLAKLGLYKPGASQNVSMDADLSYQSDRTDRINPGVAAAAPTGTKRISLEPRFTYQISRNLSGAVRFKFSRTSNIATDQTSTTLGLGVEATFVF
jgi:hypothetical protein